MEIMRASNPAPQSPAFDAQVPSSIEVRSPLDGSVLGAVPVHDAAEVVAAVERARNAQAGWAGLAPAERVHRLDGLISVIAESTDEIADLVSAETGKPRVEALVEVAIDLMRFFRKVVPRAVRGSPRLRGMAAEQECCNDPSAPGRHRHHLSMELPVFAADGRRLHRALRRKRRRPEAFRAHTAHRPAHRRAVCPRASTRRARFGGDGRRADGRRAGTDGRRQDRVHWEPRRPVEG